MQPNNDEQSPQPIPGPQPSQPQVPPVTPSQPTPQSQPQPWAQQPSFYGTVTPPAPSATPSSQPPANPYATPAQPLPNPTPVSGPAPAFGSSPQSPTSLTPPAQPSVSSVSRGSAAFILPMWLSDHWKIVTAGTIGVLMLITIGLQLVFPSNRLLPNAKVDGAAVGWMRKQDAAAKLDEAYGKLKLAIYFGETPAAFQAPTFKDVGIGTDNNERLEAMAYPWYLRIIPSSIFWADQLYKPGEIVYTYDKTRIDNYTQEKVGDDCTIPPKDASLKLVGDKLQLVPSVPGGTCDITRFQQVLAETKPLAGSKNEVRIDIRETPAMVDNDKANDLADTLNNRLATPMSIKADSSSLTIEGKLVLGWLDFKSFIPETPAGQQPDQDKIRDGSRLTFTVNKDRMKNGMAADVSPKVAIPAGTTKISTSDFTETSHVNGQTGRELDPEKTALSVENYINKKLNQAIAEPRSVAPKIVYTRTYSPTDNGFAAMLAQWPQEHPGTYAASFKELSGVTPYRSASYRGDVAMKSSGIENGFVGYAVLMGLKDSSILTSDKIVDNRLTNQCFSDMIERTDTKCSEAFMSKIGHETLVKRGQEIGLKNTIFAQTETKTSTNDLVGMLESLFRAKYATTVGGSRVLTAMQNTRMRDAIPAGISKGAVANIAGEAGTIHNDAAIVYSPKGVFLLAVMSDGAGRKDIADLAKKIDGLHSIAPPKVKK